MTKRLIDLFLIENGRYQLKQMYTDAYIITPHLFPEISTGPPEMFETWQNPQIRPIQLLRLLRYDPPVKTFLTRYAFYRIHLSLEA